MFFNSTLGAVFEGGPTRTTPMGVAFEYRVNGLPLAWHVYVDMEDPEYCRNLQMSYLLFESACCGGTIIDPTWAMFMDKGIEDTELENSVFCYACKKKAPWAPTNVPLHLEAGRIEDSRSYMALACAAFFDLDPLNALIVATDILREVEDIEASWAHSPWLSEHRAQLIADIAPGKQDD